MRASDRFHRALAVLAAVGAALGLALAPVVEHRTADSNTYLAAASAILHGSYTTPLAESLFYVSGAGWADRTELVMPRSVWQEPERQTYRTPGYPLFLALAGGGAGGLSQALLFVAQALLLGGCVFLLGLTTRRVAGERVALVAATAYAIDPYSKHYVGLVLTEMLASFFVLAAVYVAVRALQNTPSVLMWGAGGALAAALALVRPIYVFVPLLFAVAALVARAPARQRVQAAAAVLVAAAIVLTPWLAWNERATGHVALATFTEGVTLLDAAHGEGLHHTTTDVESTPAFDRDLASVHRFAPSLDALRTDPTAHPRYLARSDAELRHLAWRTYRERFADDPLQVAWEIVYRGYFMWQAHEDWYQPPGAALLVLRVLDWLVLAFAIAGACLLVRRRGAGVLIVAFLAVYTLVTAFHHSEARFGIPPRGLLLGLAAVAAVALYDRRVLRA
jgi:4-amino-4-deoxy-L-arabinose transferase-like glycosyltransferase